MAGSNEMILPPIVIGATAAALSAPTAGQNARQIWPDARHALNLDYEKRANALQQEMNSLKQADGEVLRISGEWHVGIREHSELVSTGESCPR
jgi:gas vesicle protein